MINISIILPMFYFNQLQCQNIVIVINVCKTNRILLVMTTTERYCNFSIVMQIVIVIFDTNYFKSCDQICSSTAKPVNTNYRHVNKRGNESNRVQWCQSYSRVNSLFLDSIVVWHRQYIHIVT